VSAEEDVDALVLVFVIERRRRVCDPSEKMPIGAPYDFAKTALDADGFALR
jgi:hypothetical protein